MVSEAKHPGGRPSKDRVKRTYTIDRIAAEYIDAMPEGQRSDFASLAIQTEIERRRTCCMCEQSADVECKIGKCAPSKWYCAWHYGEVHCPDEPQDE